MRRPPHCGTTTLRFWGAGLHTSCAAQPSPSTIERMPVQSAGLLLHRLRAGKLEVLLVHPGGPFWKRRDEGAWSLPKGEIEAGEDASDVARREFKEELGQPAPDGPMLA